VTLFAILRGYARAEWVGGAVPQGPWVVRDGPPIVTPCLKVGCYATVIRRALARSALGKVNVKTPSFISAFIFS
jgi:hypothetical protein